MDSNMQLRIASYCDPQTICHLCGSAQGFRSSIKPTICLPRALLKSLELNTVTLETLQEEMLFMQDVLMDDPKWITELWSTMSDYLCGERTSYPRKAFRRPPSGSVPHRMTFEEARDPKTWMIHKPLSRTRCRQHEIFRMDRLRLRVWKRSAPTAIALIY